MLAGALVGAAAMLAFGLAARPALADAKGSAKDRQQANKLVNDAIAKSQAGDHRGAIDTYLKAFGIIPDPLLLSNIGAEFQQIGKIDEALRYFCLYLEKDAGGTNAPYASAQAKALQIQLGNKNVDDRNVCVLPKPDPEPVDDDTTPAPPPPTKGKKRPPKPDPEPTGSVDSPIVETPAPADTPPADKPSSALRMTGVVGGAVGLAAIGVGIYAGVKAKDISDEITNHPKTAAWEDDIQSVQRRGQHYQDLQIGALAGGGALVVGGIVLYLLNRPGEPEHSERSDRHDKSISIAPTSNGFVVFGKF